MSCLLSGEGGERGDGDRLNRLWWDTGDDKWCCWCCCCRLNRLLSIGDDPREDGGVEDVEVKLWFIILMLLLLLLLLLLLSSLILVLLLLLLREGDFFRRSFFFSCIIVSMKNDLDIFAILHPTTKKIFKNF